MEIIIVIVLAAYVLYKVLCGSSHAEEVSDRHEAALDDELKMRELTK